MDIFIGNLPKSTSVLQLRKLMGNVCNARFRIIRRRNRSGGSYCFGHAVINSDHTCQEIISRLDGTQFNGCHLKARPFVHRSEHHERRNPKIYPENWDGVNRRRGDRRT